VIPAHARSHDKALTADFDATRYFEQADDEDLMELAKRGFRGGYPAWTMAEALAPREPALRELLDAVIAASERGEVVGFVGFDCGVDEEAARDWIRAQRPELHERIERRPAVEAAVERRVAAIARERQDPEIKW
jgi:hypothetical protein